MAFTINPKRRNLRTLKQKIFYFLKWPFVQFGLWLGFENVDYGYTSGPRSRLKIGKGCSTMNTLFNTNSGTITIGDDSIFGYNCMIITGQHRFYKGRRAQLQSDAPIKEVPHEGNDIKIGQGCFICSNVVITKGVTIGNNVIIGSGSVVTKDIPDNCFICGNPAVVKKFHEEDEQQKIVN